MPGTNYLSNPRPETNTTSWSGTNCTLAQDSTQKMPGSGTYCIKATATATGVVSVSQSAVGLTVGKRYTATIFTLVPSANSPRQVYGTAAGVSAQGTDWASETTYDRWTRLQVTFTASSATQAVTWTSDGNITSGASIYFDRMAIVDGEVAGPYFDGAYPNCSWSGTAYASTSTCSAFGTYPTTTEEPVFVGALPMNTQAWNVQNRSGRRLPAAFRGATTVVPGQSGHQFVANRPYESGVWTLVMWILGCYPDGSLPPDFADMRRLFEENLARIQQGVSKSWQPVTLYAWQADGTVRTASAQLNGMTEGALMMGGIRGEYAFAFEVLSGWWKDYLQTTVTGTPSASWSNQALSLPQFVGMTAPIEDAVVTVTGPATNPRITSDSGVWVQCNATVAAGTTWVFDSGAWTSTRNAVSNLSEVTHGGHPRFLSIPAPELMGTPKITMTASGTTSATNVSITAARSHLAA